jgi:hypothetical protein
MIYTMASNRVFHTTNGWEIHLWPIQIEIGLKAYIKCIQMSSMGMYQKEYILEGDEYQAWGSDDDYIKNYICNKETYLGRPCNVEEKPNNVLLQDDNRSVHNEADINRITSLETELEEQKKKLAQIIGLLGKTTI